LETSYILTALKTKSAAWVIHNLNPEHVAQALDASFAVGANESEKTLIDRAVDAFPLYGRILRLKAIYLAQENRPRDAINLLSLVPPKDDYFLSCMELMGLIFARNLHFDKGIAIYSMIIPKVADEFSLSFIYYQRSICFQYKGNYIDALNDCLNACRLCPEDSLYYEDAVLNVHLAILKGQINQIRPLVVSLEQICTDFLIDYYCFGPSLFLVEMAFLRNNIDRIDEIFAEFAESELSDVDILSKKVKNYHRFLKQLSKIPRPISHKSVSEFRGKKDTLEIFVAMEQHGKL
jgi:tetratricopeptide (TPR) repeat protein